MKLILDSETDKILGASLCSLDALGIMQGIAIVLKYKVTKAQFDQLLVSTRQLQKSMCMHTNIKHLH